MKKIKVMLIYPPTTRPIEFAADVVRVSAFFPLGIGYLAAVLEREIPGIDVKITDLSKKYSILNGQVSV